MAPKERDKDHDYARAAGGATSEPPKRARGLTFENVLTMVRGSRPRGISKADISSPIAADYPLYLQTTLVDRDTLSSPSVASPESASTACDSISPPLTPLEATRSVPTARRSSKPATDNRTFQLLRSNSAPPKATEFSLFPPIGKKDKKDISRWLADPQHSHAYPDLGPILTPQPKQDRQPSAGEQGRKKRSSPWSTIVKASRTQPKDPASTTSPVTPRHSDQLLLQPRPPIATATGIRSWDSHLKQHAEPHCDPFGFLELRDLTVQEQLDIACTKLYQISEAQEAENTPIQKRTLKLVATMDRASLQPPSNMGTKIRAIQQAKEMEKLVAERAKRTGDDPPPYDFFELIGKGAYGRVFKGRNRATGGLVAIKIIDTDKTDYEEMTTKNLQETLREINILQQLKDSRARPYVNIIEEARTVHNELWIVSEYASGGSVHTLMKPRLQQLKTGIEEKYIIPIARELALGLKFIHEAGVIHRDLKSNNILILEDGRVQLCDFGVSGALEPEVAKRSTIVGTPNWMAPELQREWVKDIDPSRGSRPNDILYGSEVDIWAYGCTLYEMATGFPPFHQTQPFLLPDAGVPVLEGDQYSEELKNLVSFVLQPNPRDRPTPDQILQHPYLVDSTKMHPTVTLVALVEQYYRWEQAGGSRVSLFNPYGAQAPDPLAPEPEEEEDEDWTFSTTDEFEKQFANEHSDPFGSSSTSGFPGINAPPEDDSRFAKLQASIRAEQAERGKKRLDRLFDTNATPYRFSTVDSDSNRLSSDLVLRDFNPGAPNRETVIDLDFAAPTVVDIPSIDLGEVPTVKANRINRLMREMDEEDEQEYIDLDNTARRDTREWKFPSVMDEPTRDSQTFSTPPRDRNSRRKTMEWKFDFSQLAAEPEPLPKAPRLSRRRDTRDWVFPRNSISTKETGGNQDFVFPPRDIDEPFGLSSEPPGLSSSPTLGPTRRPSLKHAATEPYGAFDDYPTLQRAPDSPMRTSMIDLDMALPDDFRPSTSGSTSTTASTSRGQENRNPFDLEDQVTLSEPNNRASYHMKSQSEPQHNIPGLLTPQVYDEQGNPTIQDSSHVAMHARGVSSVSQMQSRPAPDGLRYPRQRSQHLVPQWDTWSHQEAFLTHTSSSPVSVSPSTSAEEEESISIDERWDKLERQINAFQYQRNGGASGGGSRQFSGGYFRSSRRTASTDIDERSDADDSYASLSESGFEDGGMTVRPGAGAGQQRGMTGLNIASRLSVAPGGKPMLDFPIPRGPDLETLLKYGGGVEVEGERDADMVGKYADALWKSAKEMTEGLRASRSLLRSMRLAEMDVGGEGVEEEEEE